MEYHYQDRIYGPNLITEPVLLELIESRALQRLKGVTQHGVTALLGITPAFSRFEHSLGTMLLVRRLGAPLEEQVAALIHDVSHTAFSHVVDFVFGDDQEQSYHQREMMRYVAESDIPAILQRHGFEWREFLDEESFPLLEQPAPALCADRIDYFLRDLEFLKLADAALILQAVNALTVFRDQMVIRDRCWARWFAYTFIEADRASWSNLREVGLYRVAADAIGAGLKCGLLDLGDLWGTDEALWEKLISSRDPEVRRHVRCLSPATRFIRNGGRPAFHANPKIRTIDPPFLEDETIVPLSQTDEIYCRYMKDYLQEKGGPWPVDLIEPPIEQSASTEQARA